MAEDAIVAAMPDAHVVIGELSPMLGDADFSAAQSLVSPTSCLPAKSNS
ncbi:hypothetical protein ABDK56_11995 [Sphingomonas sp. ASV193]